MSAQCEKLFQLLDKIMNERKFWSRCLHLGFFTGQVNFCERQESIKVKINDYFGDRRMTSVDEIVRFISRTDCLQMKLEQFDEWRKVNLDVYEDLPFFDQYLKNNYTDFAINRIRYNTALGINNWVIKSENADVKVFVVSVRKTDDKETKVEDDDENVPKPQSWHKLQVFSDYVYCTCLDYFNSGLPCPHQMLLFIKKQIKVPIHCRWTKKYGELLSEMEAGSRNERVDKISEQNIWEQGFVNEQFCKQSIATKNSKETADLIKTLVDKNEIYKEDVRINVPDRSRQIAPASGLQQSPVKTQQVGGALKMGGGLGGPKKPAIAPTKTEKPLDKETDQESRIALCPLIELKLDHLDVITEKLPQVDDAASQVEQVILKILARESNEHERRNFDIKYEYGFREQKKINKLRGGKTVKKREKKEKINRGGGGRDKEKDKAYREKMKEMRKKRQKTGNNDDIIESEDEEQEPEKIIEKVSMAELLLQLTKSMEEREQSN